MAALNEVSLPLSGLLTIQQNYLNDLGRISQTNKNVAGDLADIQEKLEKINAAYEQANTSADKTLTHQTKIEDILEKEHNRLLSKKDEIDNIHYGKMRAVLLNDSHRKRQADYIRIIIAVILGIISYIGISLFLFEPISTLAAILIFVVVVIYSGNILWEIYKRDNMNHDRLDLPPPAEANDIHRTTASTDASTESAAASDAVCTGEVCCDVGSRWDASMNKCILACPDATKPISKGGMCIAESECAAPMKRCGNACISEDATCGGVSNVNPFSTLGEERIRQARQETMPFAPYEYCDYAPAL